MYGHWFSDNGTRKLNRHWQGEEILGFFNMYHVINDGLSILMPRSTDHLSVLMKKSTDHLSVLMKKSTTTLTSKMVKSNNRMSIKMTKITESGKIMYTTRGNGKFKKVAKSVATAGPFNIITNSGDAFKKLYDNEDLLSSSTTRFLGFQVSVLYCDKTYVGQTEGYSGFNTYGLKNMDANISPKFYPLSIGDNTYPASQYIDAQPPSVDIIKLYNENCKHNLSQMGNTEYIGSDYINDDYYGDFNMMWLITSIDLLSITKDLNDDSVLNGTEVGTEEIVMKISNYDFNATGGAPQRMIPIIGKSILGIPTSTGSGRCADLAYIFTPTVYDEKGNIATLKR